GEGALRHQRRDDGDPPGLGQLEQLRRRMAVEDAAADVENRLLRLDERLGRLDDLAWVDALRRAPPGQIDGVRIGEVELGLLYVLRDIDEHGPAAAGRRD